MQENRKFDGAPSCVAGGRGERKPPVDLAAGARENDLTMINFSGMLANFPPHRSMLLCICLDQIIIFF